MKFIAILFAVLFVFFSSLFMTRFWGLGLQYQAYEHPFLKELPNVAVRIYSTAEAEELAKVSPNALVWLDLRPTQDGKFLVLSDTATEKILTFEALGADTFHGNKPSYYDLVFLRKFFATAPLAEDVIAAMPNSRFVFNIIDSVLDVDKNLIAFIEQHKLSDRVLLQSSADDVLTSIKKERPTWVFGSSQTDWVKILSFSSAYILPAAPFKGDVLAMPLEIKNRELLEADLIIEMHRRFKKVFAGPLTNVEQFKKAVAMRPDLYVLSGLSLLRDVAPELNSK